MYKCSVCGHQTGPGEARRVHYVMREVPRPFSPRAGGPPPHLLNGTGPNTRLEVARELPVCRECDYELANGVPLVTLVRRYAKPAETVPAFLKRPAKPAFLSIPPLLLRRG